MAGTYGTSNDEVSLLIARQKKSQTHSSSFLKSCVRNINSSIDENNDDDDNDNDSILNISSEEDNIDNIKIFNIIDINDEKRKKRARLYRGDSKNDYLDHERKPPSPPPAWGVLGIVASGIVLFGVLFLL